jgi:hypothetical protein
MQLLILHMVFPFDFLLDYFVIFFQIYEITIDSCKIIIIHEFQ